MTWTSVQMLMMNSSKKYIKIWILLDLMKRSRNLNKMVVLRAKMRCIKKLSKKVNFISIWGRNCMNKISIKQSSWMNNFRNSPAILSSETGTVMLRKNWEVRLIMILKNWQTNWRMMKRLCPIRLLKRIRSILIKFGRRKQSSWTLWWRIAAQRRKISEDG